MSSSPACGMHLRHTFKGFVVGPSNQAALAACRAASKPFKHAHSLLFVHGGVGLGKTHLLSAIEHRLFQHDPDARVARLSTEKFAAEHHLAHKTGAMEGFLHRYQQLDMLLLDDIQFLADDRVGRTMRQLFDLPRRRIVVTCDRPMPELTVPDHSLARHFMDFKAIALLPPSYRTRLAILHLKAKTIPLDLPVAVLERLARRLPGYIRRLEGAMFRIAQPSGGKNVPPDIAVVDDLIVELLKAEQI